jgi:pimeloyl-ACP methyl ester carboxylesterase
LLAAARQPERFKGIVTIAAPSRWESTPDRELFIQGLAQGRQALLTRFVRWCMPEPNTESLQRWVLQLLMESEPEAGPALIRNLYGCALPANISEMSMPALVIHGRQDTITPPDNAAQITAAVPGAQLLLLDEVGHVPTVTRPRQVAEAIRSFAGTG